MARTRNTKGFTLVELLIAVAIIGILATVGVPTYRRMVQKARKSEARVALGALYTSEAAFFSEYGTYGDNLGALGVDNPSNQYYTFGFVQANCTALNAAARPAVGTTQGDQINAAFSSYFTGPYVPKYDVVQGGAAVVMPECQASTFAANGLTFIASASGVIQQGQLASAANLNPGADDNTVDVWTINQARTLNNSVDGTN